MLSERPLLDKFLILIGNSLLFAFLIINFFNIIPLRLNNFIWLQKSSMLLVDTGSFLLLGFSSLFFVNKTKLSLIEFNINKILDKTDKNLNEIINDEKSDIKEDLLRTKEVQNIFLKRNSFLKKLSLSSLSIYILIIPLQFFILFKGISAYDSNYSSNLNNINNQFDTYVKEETNKDNIELQKIKKLELSKALQSRNNQQRFTLFQNTFRIIILSIIWLIAIFKITNF